jgi:hypothetical protein
VVLVCALDRLGFELRLWFAAWLDHTPLASFLHHHSLSPLIRHSSVIIMSRAAAASHAPGPAAGAAAPLAAAVVDPAGAGVAMAAIAVAAIAAGAGGDMMARAEEKALLVSLHRDTERKATAALARPWNCNFVGEKAGFLAATSLLLREAWQQEKAAANAGDDAAKAASRGPQELSGGLSIF